MTVQQERVRFVKVTIEALGDQGSKAIHNIMVTGEQWKQMECREYVIGRGLLDNIGTVIDKVEGRM